MITMIIKMSYHKAYKKALKLYDQNPNLTLPFFAKASFLPDPQLDI